MRKEEKKETGFDEKTLREAEKSEIVDGQNKHCLELYLININIISDSILI